MIPFSYFDIDTYLGFEVSIEATQESTEFFAIFSSHAINYFLLSRLTTLPL